MKSIIFARVSSREQEDTGYSLDAQVKLLQEYANKKDFEVVKVCRISESASGRQIRKIFNETLSYIIKHNIPIILCEKIDRLTRNPKDASLIDDWVKEDAERAVHFVKESFILNNNTKAHESLVWDMKVAIARFYTNNLSEEVKKGMAEKARQGWLPSKPPLGYKTIGDKGHKIHALDEGVAPLVERMFELYATGNYSTKSLVKKMFDAGLRTRKGQKLGKSMIHNYLSDPFYVGKVRWNNQDYNGSHRALISKELFEAVQKILNRKIANPQYKKHLPVFKAKIICETCNGVVTWEIQKGHWYGHCNSYRNCPKRKYLRQEEVEKQLFPYFDHVAPKSELALKTIEQALRESQEEEINYNTSEHNKLDQAIKTADRRIETAYRDKIDNRMPVELCEKIIKESTQEKENAIKTLNRLSSNRSTYYEAGIKIHELAYRAKEIYSSAKATNEDRRLLLSYVFSNLTLNGDKIMPEYTPAFEFLAEWVPRINQIFEPGKMLDNKGQSPALAGPCPVWLPG